LRHFQLCNAFLFTAFRPLVGPGVRLVKKPDYPQSFSVLDLPQRGETPEKEADLDLKIENGGIIVVTSCCADVSI